MRMTNYNNEQNLPLPLSWTPRQKTQTPSSFMIPSSTGEEVSDSWNSCVIPSMLISRVGFSPMGATQWMRLLMMRRCALSLWWVARSLRSECDIFSWNSTSCFEQSFSENMILLSSRVTASVRYEMFDLMQKKFTTVIRLLGIYSIRLSGMSSNFRNTIQSYGDSCCHSIDGFDECLLVCIFVRFRSLISS